MRLTSTAFFFCMLFALNAQEGKSLLWEISGNGLDQSSYLYGTMHVSKKIAFHLDDVFYEALLASEMIALESDPGTWLEADTDRSGGHYRHSNGVNPKGFYSRAFQMKPPSKRDLAKYLATEDRLINNILYRTNEFNQNFEEDTYLDMFIYRAGAKFGKPVMALEDPELTNALVGRASLNAMKSKPDEWLQEKMKKQDLAYLMQDAYRERDINMLDSIDRAMYTEYYRKNMLYIRNEQMAEKLDAIMPGTKVFAGIGAAHLPGKKGVISLLKAKGYTVTPLVSAATDKGKSVKKQLESKVRRTPLKTVSPEDRFFSISLPNELFPVNVRGKATYVSPDLANGSYMVVHRIPRYHHIKKEESLSLDDIDQLLYENIPGRIVSRYKINRGGYSGLDIQNQLKNGDQQRYQIFITPLEFLIIKMAGEGDYVSRFSDPVFESLRFNQAEYAFQTLRPVFKDFEVLMPGLHHFYNPNGYGDRFVESLDPETENYYFLKRATLNDFHFLEEDDFELKQIQRRFYEDINLEGEYESIEGHTLYSQASMDEESGKTLYLKSTLAGNEYYLLGCITRDFKAAAKYLESFTLNQGAYPEEFKQVVDTAMYFSTRTMVEPQKFVEKKSKAKRSNELKPYEAYLKKTVYQTKNNEAIAVELNKTHDLMAFDHVDSLWKMRRSHYEKKNFRIAREQKQSVGKDTYEYRFVLTDSGSTRGILVKNLLKGGRLYELKTVIDTLQEPSEFVSSFYDNFTPLDTIIGSEILKDKAPEFFSALKNRDSLLLNGFQYPGFGKQHIDSLTYYLTHHEFKNDQKPIELHLISQLGAIESTRVVAFFKQHYPRSFKNSIAQAKILQAIASARNDQSVQLILDLLAQDLPLAADSKEIEKIFMPYRDSLELAKKLFPELLEYSTITEYKLPIISLLASLKSSGYISSGRYRSYKKFILNDARIQLKRHLGQVNGEANLDQRNALINRKQTTQLLDDYLVLLYPFIKDNAVHDFFGLLHLVKEPEIKTTYAQLMAVDDEHAPLGLIDSLAGDINSRLMMYTKLAEIGKTYLFPESYHTQEALAEAALFQDRRFLPTYDEVIYLGDQVLKDGNHSYKACFFKVRSQMDYHKSFKFHVVAYENDENNTLSTRYEFKNEGYLLPDTDSESDGIEHVTEEFLLRNRKRAMVSNKGRSRDYGYLGL